MFAEVKQNDRKIGLSILSCWTLMFLKWNGKYYWNCFGIESSFLPQEVSYMTTPINGHNMVIWTGYVPCVIVLGLPVQNTIGWWLWQQKFVFSPLLDPMLTGWMSAESSLWELLFSVCSNRLSWVTLQGEKARGDGRRGRKSDLLVSLLFYFFYFFIFFFYQSSNHPDFMITEILQISTVGEHHYNKYWQKDG